MNNMSGIPRKQCSNFDSDLKKRVDDKECGVY